MYSSVPTKEFVRKSAMHDLVSTRGYPDEVEPFRVPRIMVGAPPASDCFDRSKSDNMIWPDWWSRMSACLSLRILHGRGRLTFRLEISVDKSHEV